MSDNLQWHPAFCYAMRLELRDVEGLSYQDEFDLTDKPLKIDLMIVKKGEDIIITNRIGKIFKGHNIVEYKSPEDALDIRTFYKAIAYACLYMISPKHNEVINANDVTITLLRDAKPTKLLKTLSNDGYKIEDKGNGIYYVKGFPFDIQIIVSSKLDKKENKWLSSLNTDISYELYLSLYSEKDKELNEREKEMADNVLQVVTQANANAIKKWKESEIMCQALKDIMKPELDENTLVTRIKTYSECGKTLEEIAELCNCSLEYVNEVLFS